MKSYTAEDLQIDLFAPTRPILCPALEKWQESYEKIMEGNSSHHLCSSWKDAEKNHCGVFTTNSKMFPAGDMKNGVMTLKLAKFNGSIYGELDLQMGAPFYYGRGIPLDEDSYLIATTEKSVEYVRERLHEVVEKEINKDLNLHPEQRTYLTNLKDNVIEKALMDMV